MRLLQVAAAVPEDATQKTWFARGRNFVVAYSEAKPGAVFVRDNQVDEYALLLPEADTAITVEAGGETKEIGGYTLTFIPAGASKVTVTAGGPVIRRHHDAERGRCFARPPILRNMPACIRRSRTSWPGPIRSAGFRIRTYSLDVPDEPGRFGKLFRCTTFMVNVFPPAGPRDPAKLSPHHHDDFEQCSLATAGTYVHHLRWPWTANLADWQGG